MTWVIFPTALGVAIDTFSFGLWRSDHGQCDGHVAARGARIGANLVGVLDQGLDLGLVGAGQRNLHFGLEAKADLGLVHRDRASYTRVLRIDTLLHVERHAPL